MELLYVDDEPSLLELGKEFLELESDVAVTIQTCPVKALAMLNDRHFDTIVSDYMMPGMDGLEFFKRLRATGNATPFILFTGKGREEVVIEATVSTSTSRRAATPRASSPSSSTPSGNVPPGRKRRRRWSITPCGSAP
jgi:CheY-like chemotaxis protein